MNKQLKRAVAAAAACAAGAAGTLAIAPTADAAAAGQSSGKISNFGYEAWASGTKAFVGGVEVKTLKDAYAAQTCTRRTGLEQAANSLATATDYLPIPNDLVKIAPSSSTTSTYQTGTVNGVKAINTIADIAIGGQVVQDTSIPTIKIQGLQAIADSFHDSANPGEHNGYGTDQSFTFQGIGIDYSGTVVDGTPLAQLLDIVNSTTETVVQQVNDLVTLLTQQTGNLIDIPGLGSIGLGYSNGKVTDHSAASRAYGLAINVLPHGDTPGTKVILGRATSTITGPVTSGVFRSTVDALDLKVGGGLLHLGGVENRLIPCSGTDGTTLTNTVDNVSFPVDGLGIFNLSNVKYAWSGQQLAAGRAQSKVTSTVGDLTIDSLGLEIKGLTTTLKYLAVPDKRVKPKLSVDVADILYDGQSLLKGVKPTLGQLISFPNKLGGEDGLIRYGAMVSQKYTGSSARGAQIAIPVGGELVQLDLGVVASHFIRQG